MPKEYLHIFGQYSSTIYHYMNLIYRTDTFLEPFSRPTSRHIYLKIFSRVLAFFKLFILAKHVDTSLFNVVCAVPMRSTWKNLVFRVQIQDPDTLHYLNLFTKTYHRLTIHKKRHIHFIYFSFIETLISQAHCSLDPVCLQHIYSSFHFPPFHHPPHMKNKDRLVVLPSIL